MTAAAASVTFLMASAATATSVVATAASATSTTTVMLIHLLKEVFYFFFTCLTILEDMTIENKVLSCKRVVEVDGYMKTSIGRCLRISLCLVVRNDIV